MYSENDQKQIIGEKKLAFFFTSTRYPYKMLNCDQFKDLIQHFDPKFKISDL
jgi:hypothetical protein